MEGTFSLVTSLPPLVCKSIAKASKVRILHLPPRAERAPDLRKRGSGALSCGPAVIGSNRLSTAVRGESAGKFRPRPALRQPRSAPTPRLDARLRDLILAIDALGVDPEEDIHTVPGPLGDLGGRDPGAQPSRYGRVAQVVRALGQRRGELGIGKSGSTRRSPDPIGGAHAQGLYEGRWQRNAGATDSGDEQAAVGARRECLDVLAEDLDEFWGRWHGSRVAHTMVLQLAVLVCLASRQPRAADSQIAVALSELVARADTWALRGLSAFPATSPCRHRSRVARGAKQSMALSFATLTASRSVRLLDSGPHHGSLIGAKS